MIDASIHTLLNTVSTDNFPGKAPQEQTGTYTIYRILSTEPSTNKTGASHADVYTLVIDVYADLLKTAKTLAASIRETLDFYSGGTITSITFVDQGSDIDFTSDKHNVTQTYRIRELI